MGGGDAAGTTAETRCPARYWLGTRPVVALFRRLCRPLATPAIPSAIQFARRLVAMDGRPYRAETASDTSGANQAASR